VTSLRRPLQYFVRFGRKEDLIYLQTLEHLALHLNLDEGGVEDDHVRAYNERIAEKIKASFEYAKKSIEARGI
jgi:hypothetical protein